MRNTLKISAIALIAAALTTLPVAAATINLGGNGSGGLLNLGGNNSNTSATVGTDNLIDDGTGNATVRSNLLGGTNNGQALDLFGNGSDPTTADVNLGGTGGGGTDGNVLLDLFGDGSSPGSTATIALGGAGTGTGGTGATTGLFGTGDDGTGGTGTTGSGGGFGGNARTIGTVQIASIDTKAATTACFMPNDNQVAKLVNRHDYAASTLDTWANASSIKVVDVGLCDAAGKRIASESNIGRLQTFISDHPALRDGLSKLGRTPSDVVGADKTGDALTFYVM